jgi:hypothetical protein
MNVCTILRVWVRPMHITLNPKATPTPTIDRYIDKNPSMFLHFTRYQNKAGHSLVIFYLFKTLTLSFSCNQKSIQSCETSLKIWR